MNVRRQRNVADRVDGRVDADVRVRPESNAPPAEELALQNLAMNHRAVTVAAFEPQTRTGFQLLPGMHQRGPDLIVSAARRAVRFVTSQQQTFDGPAARHAAAQQPRRKHARVVDHQQVAAPKKAREIANPRVRHRATAAIQHEQPRLAARRGGLRDQLVRKMKVEVGYFHGWKFTEVTEATDFRNEATEKPIRQISRRPIHKTTSTRQQRQPEEHETAQAQEQPVTGRRTRARLRMPLEERQVPVVGLPHEVERVADDGNGADAGVDQRVDDHPREHRLGHPLTRRLPDQQQRQHRRRHVADPGNETKDRIEAEPSPACPGMRNALSNSAASLRNVSVCTACDCSSRAGGAETRIEDRDSVLSVRVCGSGLRSPHSAWYQLSVPNRSMRVWPGLPIRSAPPGTASA